MKEIETPCINSVIQGGEPGMVFWNSIPSVEDLFKQAMEELKQEKIKKVLEEL